ncbi:MAG: hypothetical protein AAFX06_21335 [Planctomycetota bacterium]
MARLTGKSALSKSLIPLGWLVSFGVGLVASAGASTSDSEPPAVVPPSNICQGCQEEWAAWFAAAAAADAAELEEQNAMQDYQDCMQEQGGGSGTPPRLKDSGDSILVTTNADLSE